MNWNMNEGNSKPLTSNTKELCGEPTEDELDTRAQLLNTIQGRYAASVKAAQV